MTDPTREEISKLAVNAAIQNPSVPKFYMNGFSIGQSATDMFLVMNLMDRPMCMVHMSFNTAKTLMSNLQEAFATLERKIKQPILSMNEIQDNRDEQEDS